MSAGMGRGLKYLDYTPQPWRRGLRPGLEPPAPAPAPVASRTRNASASLSLPLPTGKGDDSEGASLVGRTNPWAAQAAGFLQGPLLGTWRPVGPPPQAPACQSTPRLYPRPPRPLPTARASSLQTLSPRPGRGEAQGPLVSSLEASPAPLKKLMGPGTRGVLEGADEPFSHF